MSTEQAYLIANGTNIPTTTETVVATILTPPENQPTGQGMLINAQVNMTPGAGTTSVIVRIRQGSLTGAVVGQPNAAPATAALANSTFAAMELDTTVLYPVGNTYVITVQQTAATGNGTITGGVVDIAPCTGFVG